MSIEIVEKQSKKELQDFMDKEMESGVKFIADKIVDVFNDVTQKINNLDLDIVDANNLKLNFANNITMSLYTNFFINNFINAIANENDLTIKGILEVYHASNEMAFEAVKEKLDYNASKQIKSKH